MNKLLFGAFEKLQKREHLLKVLRDQLGLGRITREEFKKHEAKALQRYSLTEAEEREYDLHVRMTRKRRG